MGREAERVAGVVALSFQPFAGMLLTRSLPSTPSASPRDSLQFFNSLPGADDMAAAHSENGLLLQPGRELVIADGIGIGVLTLFPSRTGNGDRERPVGVVKSVM